LHVNSAYSPITLLAKTVFFREQQLELKYQAEYLKESQVKEEKSKPSAAAADDDDTYRRRQKQMMESAIGLCVCLCV
jgi:hypothetical protein